MSVNPTPKNSQPVTRNSSPRESNKEDQNEQEEPTDIDLEKLKEHGLNEVRVHLKREKSKYGKNVDSFIRPSDEFLSFIRKDLCDQLLVASIFYASSTLALSSQFQDDEIQYSEQEKKQAESFQILSSLYCQLLLSSDSSNLPVRKERIFYETLFYFIDTCVCFVIHTAPSEKIIDILAGVFRGGLQDPNSRKEIEFLPISEIVKKHWLSQRVPGKTRSTVSHSTLRGTTHLISPICDVVDPTETRTSVKREVSRNVFAKTPSIKGNWDENGYPINTTIPFKAKLIPISSIYTPPSIKNTPETTSSVPTRDSSPRTEKANFKAEAKLL